MSEETTQDLPNGDLKRILAGLDSIAARLTTLEDKVDRRLQETRPIWEQVLIRLDKIESVVEELRTDVEEFRNETRQNFRTLERRLSVLADDVVAVRADQRDLESRMDKLESEPAQ